jgi:protein-S-isoprenylcysteine O-methyltransferase Ste14
MRRSTAAIGSAVYFAVAAGIFAVLVPWLVTGWQFHRPWSYWAVAQAAGVLLIGAGLVPVVSGFNRYVRNPVYLGSLLIFSGEALLFGSLRLLVYTAAGWAGAAVFVRWYEEPALTRRFGAEYQAYRRAVPAWRPRLHLWSG